MPNSTRREFLRVLATTAGASATLAAFPPVIRKALAIPAKRVNGTLEDVEHIVIFMQENRSFDHYFGVRAGVRGFGDPRARQTERRCVGRPTSPGLVHRLDGGRF
jgi:phospholipase C